MGAGLSRSEGGGGAVLRHLSYYVAKSSCGE